MFNFYRILPVLVLASALSPVAANARSDRAPEVASQYLVNTANPAPAFSRGRAAEMNVPVGQVITNNTPAYAAAYAQGGADDTFSG